MPCGNLLKRLKRISKSPKRASTATKFSVNKEPLSVDTPGEVIQTTKKRQRISKSPKRASTATKFSVNKEPLSVDTPGEVIQTTKKRHVEEESLYEPETTFEFERLPCPTKSSTDRNDYSVIRLSNGVVATIVSEGQENQEKGQANHSKGEIELKQLRTEASTVKLGNDSRLKNESSMPTKIGSARELSKMSTGPKSMEEDVERGFNLVPTQAFAACAVTVELGSFNDPDNIPGLCHLLEHVLSMGSDKFVGEDEFDVFLGENGGSYDAETETEYMSFYFECQDTFLYAAMEMFSRFFVAPLMRWDSIRRERLAVASEFSEQSNSDNARRMQIICTSANSNNPAKRFAWGNLETLKNKIGDDQLLTALKHFRDTNFTADKVKIAVQAKLPMETLEGWVNMLFSGIPKKAANPEVPRPLETPFDKAKFCKLYKVQSVGYICDVNINWALPPMGKKYRNKPMEYISYVIGAEGEGSLISYLRGKQMALYLTSEVEEGGLVSNSLYTIFTICVSLTEEGRHNVQKVVKAVFGYLKMLKNKGISQSIWSELQKIAEISFKFNRAQRPAENVRLISQGMKEFPPKDYLTGWTKFFEFSGEEIQKCLLAMTPANANILLHMKNHEDKLDKEERWFKTKYRIDDIPASWIHEWNAAEPEISFDVPPSNPYIADDFSLVERGNVERFPKKVIDKNFYEVWYKGDKHFNVPYATINILLGTPQEHQTVENIVCQMVFAKMFVYQMIDELYFAQVAHIEHKMVSTEYGLEISIHGISQKLPKVLKEVARGLVEFREKEEAQQHMLKYLKVGLERNIINTLSNGASLIEDIRKSITSSLTFTSGEKYQLIRAITKEEIDEYWQEMLGNLNVVALVQGNITANKAKAIVEEFAHVLKATGKIQMVAQPTARAIPTGESIICIAAFNPQEENCYTQYYYQFGQGSTIDSVALQIFVARMTEPLFDELRTKEQLGYSVSITMSEISGVLGVIITVNSQITRHSPEYVRTRIDTFVRDYLKYFRTISRGEFDEVKNVFLAMKQMKPETLKDESSRNWWEIKNRGEFDRSTKEIEAISRLDKKCTVKVVDRTMDFSKANSLARKLVLQVVGFKPDSVVDDDDRSAIADDAVIYRSAFTEAFTPSSKVVKDVLVWKNSLPTYNLK